MCPTWRLFLLSSQLAGPNSVASDMRNNIAVTPICHRELSLRDISNMHSERAGGLRSTHFVRRQMSASGSKATSEAFSRMTTPTQKADIQLVTLVYRRVN